MFMTTANILDTIQPALRDRMEIILLSGYTEEEKLEIARRHLVPKQIEENGLEKDDVKFDRTALARSLSANIRRKPACASSSARSARSAARSPAERPRTSQFRSGQDRTAENLQELFARAEDLHRRGAEKRPDRDRHRAGVDGRRRRHLVYRGDQDKGQRQAALDRPAGRSDAGIGAGGVFLCKGPGEGARDRRRRFSTNTTSTSTSRKARSRKTVRSAGITMATAIVSVLSQRPVRKDVAMTGEITLRGNVLPIGGVKEKILAARRARIKTVIFPEPNKRDLEDLPQEVGEDLNFIFVENVRQVFREALLPVDAPVDKAKSRAGASA